MVSESNSTHSHLDLIDDYLHKLICDATIILLIYHLTLIEFVPCSERDCEFIESSDFGDKYGYHSCWPSLRGSVQSISSSCPAASRCLLSN